MAFSKLSIADNAGGTALPLPGVFKDEDTTLPLPSVVEDDYTTLPAGGGVDTTSPLPGPKDDESVKEKRKGDLLLASSKLVRVFFLCVC